MLDKNISLLHSNKFIEIRKKQLAYFLNFLLDNKIILFKVENNQDKSIYFNNDDYKFNLKAEEITKKFFETDFTEGYFLSWTNDLTYYPLILTAQYQNHGILSSIIHIFFNK